jgi:hypothetical protein
VTASTNSDFRVLVEKARAQGFRVELTKGGHYKFTPPDPAQRVFYAASTPSRPSRFIQHVRRDLRSRGAVI